MQIKANVKVIISKIFAEINWLSLWSTNESPCLCSIKYPLERVGEANATHLRLIYAQRTYVYDPYVCVHKHRGNILSVLYVNFVSICVHFLKAYRYGRNGAAPPEIVGAVWCISSETQR